MAGSVHWHLTAIFLASLLLPSLALTSPISAAAAECPSDTPDCSPPATAAAPAILAQQALAEQPGSEAQASLLQRYHRSWQHSSLWRGLTDGGLLPLPMLQLEWLQLHLAVRHAQQRLRARLDDQQSGLSRYQDLISSSLTLLLALALFIAARQLALRSTGLLLRWHDWVLKRANKRHLIKALARFVSGLAPLAPWLLLWLALQLLAQLFSAQGREGALHSPWWLPLAQWYVLLGILKLLGEWLLLRLCSSAGVFLNNDQTRELGDFAHRQIQQLMLPWLLLLLIELTLGPSLLYRIVELAAWLVLWWALARLLRHRRDEYLNNLKRLLPPASDPLVERFGKSGAFLLLAPLLLPLQLLLFSREYLDQLLADFDWYRALNARWFRLRTEALQSDDETTNAETAISAQYEQWFVAEERADLSPPMIDTGLLEAALKPIHAWQRDHTNENVLLVSGEKGIGKSTLMRRLAARIEKDVPELVVRELTVPAKTLSRAAILQQLGNLLDQDLSDGPAALARHDDTQAETVVLLDNAENLFLAEVGQLDGWRTLIDLTNTRLENLFWVIAIDNQSWAYLCNVFGREYQMRNVLRIKRWSQSEVRSLILSRHHLSDYRLRYDDTLLAARGADSGNLRNAEQRCFSLLWDSCRGIPMAALALWLTAIRCNAEEVTVSLPKLPVAAPLEKLGPKLQFVYAAIVTHENLTSAEISMVTNQPENVVRYALKAALEAEFIVRGDDGRYRIAPLWYHTVISYLTRKNMLHE